MGNAWSVKKNNESDLSNQEALSIRIDDCDDEVDDIASQCIVEIPIERSAPPPIIPDMAYPIAEMLGDKHFPRKFFNKSTGEETEISEKINALSAFSCTSIKFYAKTSTARIAYKCALLAAQGNEKKIKQLFAISPAHIRYMTAKATFKDFSNRTFHCSAFQYALWARDWHMWNMMLTALDEAEALAIPKMEWDALPEEAKRRKPYFGAISIEEILAIRIALFQQYKEVVDTGLNYTITRYQRIPDLQGKYHLLNPRTISVCGETHFDLKGPEFCLMPQTSHFNLEKGKFYVKIEDGALHYQVIALSGKPVEGHIQLTELQCPLHQLDTISQLTPYIPTILNITAQADYTHPKTLISAFETYLYALNNNWTYSLLRERWCNGVGMAEREVPAVVAQEFCREDIVLDVARGEFKELEFPRTFKFHNWNRKFHRDEYWFSLEGANQKLGMTVGIINCVRGCYPAQGGRPVRIRDRDTDTIIKRISRNLAALSALNTTRALDIVKLRRQLDPENYPHLTMGQVPQAGFSP